MTNWMRYALVAMALPLLAQDARHALEAQASLVSVAPETRRLINGRALAGTSLGLAYRGEIRPGLEQRIHVDLMGLRAAEVTGMDGAAPKHLELGWDVLFLRGKWSFFSGIVALRWKQSIDDKTSDGFRDYNIAGTTNNYNSAAGTKLGARVGAEYAFRKDLSGFVAFTHTEFNKQHNPAWWQIGVAYKGWKR